MGMGAVTGIGAWGQEINKSNSEASAKGLSPRQQHALKGAAQIMGNDENYFVDMYGKLDNARKNWSKTSDYFSQLGIKDIQSLEDIKDPRELIHKVVSEIQKNKKEGKLDFKGNAKLIDDSVENLLGVNLQEALSIDVKDFNEKYKAKFNSITDTELKRMGKMGSEFTDLFQTIKDFALSITSNLAPALSKLFKAVKEGLANFKNSDTFKSIMDSMRKFFDSASGKASGAIKSFFDNLPNLVKKMSLTFDSIRIAFLKIQAFLAKENLFMTETSKSKSYTAQAKALEDELEIKRGNLLIDEFNELVRGKGVDFSMAHEIFRNKTALNKLLAQDQSGTLRTAIQESINSNNSNIVIKLELVNGAQEIFTASQQTIKGIEVGSR